MTIEQMQLKLKSLGLKKTYFPVWDQEAASGRGKILLRMRHEVEILDGKLTRGGQIDLYDDHIIRVWTPKTKLARKLAQRNKIKIRMLTGECEIFVPVELADLLLHPLGARAKKQLSQKSLDAMTARISTLRAKTPSTVKF